MNWLISNLTDIIHNLQVIEKPLSMPKITKKVYKVPETSKLKRKLACLVRLATHLIPKVDLDPNYAEENEV